MHLVVGCDHLAAALSVALDVTGREHLIVVAKATWALPEDERESPEPLPPQPLSHQDSFHGPVGESALRYGDDFARFKPRCDVLFDARAHAPGGRPVDALGVSIQVGGLEKRLKVLGPRTWQRRSGRFTLSDPQPFVSQPLHYGLAFGGSLPYLEKGQRRADTYLPNPVGCGWAGPHTLEGLVGAPAPQLEAFDDPILRPSGHHRPMALSGIGRNHQDRSRHAGTYDARWREEVFPFLPEDFDERYHQCAPTDQQMDYPTGGEPVRLVHLLAQRPEVRFRLPELDMLQVRILRKDYSQEQPPARVDTLFFETEAGRFSAVWRASTPIRRRIQEFDTIAVGPVDDARWRDGCGGGGSGCTGCGKGQA